MQNLQTIKVGCFIALFITIMLLPVNAFATIKPANNWLDEPVTVRFQNESLSMVLEKISKQTGIAILYDQELANEKVSGNYKAVIASDAITRLFSGKNKSIQVSKDKKVIVVKTFGAKKFIWAGAGKGSTGKGQKTGPMTLSELEKLHVQQYKEYKERIANDSEILEEGMTRGELRAMHEQQYKEYKERIANDSEILEEGMTRGDLRTMQEQQYRDYQARLFDDNEILEEGMTRGELRTMQEQQYRDYQACLVDNNEILEEGMTRGELRTMQEQQYKEYEKSNNNPLRIIVE